MYPHFRESTVRVLIETIRLTKGGNRVQIVDIASSARTSESFAWKTLTDASIELNDGRISLGSKLRIRLALDIARVGRLRDSVQVLTWQEFEKFAGECLEDAGFQTEKNVRIRANDRAWQIDLVGFRGELVLTMDCKHWNTPGHVSRFRLPAEHQKAATLHLLATLGRSIPRDKKPQALPVILTLSEPPSQFSEDVALVSIEKLSSFLNSVTPYDENLPFLSLPSFTVENPMSQSN